MGGRPASGTYRPAVSAPARATSGSPMNMKVLTPSGMISSLINNLSVSAKGWNQRGPTRFCMSASNLWSAHSYSKPLTTRNNPPGKTSSELIPKKTFICRRSSKSRCRAGAIVPRSSFSGCHCWHPAAAPCGRCRKNTDQSRPGSWAHLPAGDPLPAGSPK